MLMIWPFMTFYCTQEIPLLKDTPLNVDKYATVCSLFVFTFQLLSNTTQGLFENQ